MVVVTSVEKKHSAAGVLVYNLIVQDDHTYFIGNGQEWVHNGLLCPIHHIATDKNFINGLQWSSEFEPLFNRFGVSMDEAANKVGLVGDVGPHPAAYHQWVLDHLEQAVDRADFLNRLQQLKDTLLSNPTMANHKWHGPFPP